MASNNNGELPSNSFKDKQEKKVKAPVVQAKVKKKTFGEKVADTFIEDDVDSVKDYIIHDVLVPNIKDVLYDIFSGSMEMILFGGSNSGRSRSHSTAKTKSGKGEYVSYSAYYNGKRSSEPVRSRRNGSYEVKDIICETKDEATTVLDSLQEAMDQYDGYVSVCDLYDTVGVAASFQDQKWGWTDIRGACVRRVRDGYMIVMPEPEYLQ
jgi:hypothetical protein